MKIKLFKFSGMFLAVLLSIAAVIPGYALTVEEVPNPRKEGITMGKEIFLVLTTSRCRFKR